MKRLSGLVVVLAVLLAAASALASVPGELLIWIDSERFPVMQEVGAQFEEEYGIPVRVQEMPFGDIRDNLGVVAPTGEGPDIIIGAHDWLGQLVTDGLLMEIDIADESLFLESALDAFTWEGKRYAIPYAIEAIGLFYNKDLVGDTPPDSFEELIAIGEKLKEEGKYALVMPQPDPYHTYPFFSALGGDRKSTRLNSSHTS